MIQRIQSLYLLLVTLLVAVTLFTPLATFASEAGVFELHAFSFRTVGGDVSRSTLYLGLLLAAACLLPAVTIGCFRNRMLQLRLCFVELVLLFGAAVMEGVYYYLGNRLFADAAFHTHRLHVAIALPVVALLFVWLAIRAIFRDELLVRDADRIR